jgi:putative transposase
MSQSLVKNYLHIVFSTKHRQNLIVEGIEGELYAYLGGICKRLACQPVKIGGHVIMYISFVYYPKTSCWQNL